MFTVDDVVAQVRALAKDNPTFIYATQTDGPCSYLYDHSGRIPRQGCIVGRALASLGLDDDYLETLDNVGGATSVLDHLIEDRMMEPIEGSFVDDADDPRGRFLAAVQDSQDGGMPWGEAVYYAESR